MAAPSATFLTDLKVNMTPDTVDIRTTSTVNNYGERAFTGSATTYDAYIRRANEADRDENELTKVAWVVYIPDSSLTLNVEDQITLPSPISAIRPLVKVETKKDPLGQVAVVAYVGNK
jgi:hypothetical protein